MFVFVGYSRWVACVQDRMPSAIMVCSTASANQTASATTGFSAAILPHLLIAVLAIAGVMAMGAGGLLLFGSGFSAASQSHVGPLPVTSFAVTGVRWGNESWIGDFLRGASSPSRSLAGSALLSQNVNLVLCPFLDSDCCYNPSTR
jgi:hypothetical protein